MSLLKDIEQFKTAFDELFLNEVRRILEEQQSFHNYRSVIDEHLKKSVIEYSRGGKRIRPFLISYFAETSLENTDVHSACLASELFQTAALIHDDIMDNDEQRRGVPTIHHALESQQKESHTLGRDIALLMGDVFLTASLRYASKLPEVARELFFTMVQRTTRGQYFDALGMNEVFGELDHNILDARYELKTAWYSFASPIEIGLMLGNHSYTQQDIEVAKNIGMLYQISDDIKDCLGIPGKDRFGDIFSNQTTWVTLYIKNEYPTFFEELKKLKDQKNIAGLEMLFSNIDLQTPYQEKYQEIAYKLKALEHSEIQTKLQRILELLQ